jgi:hypothetical protein
MRKKNIFNEITAQKAKDDGPAKFRKLVEETKDGVLFIDEAYELDPKTDMMGKSILSEILTYSENSRHELSIILAGYEEDIQTKLYDFNVGLKSRFSDVIFEDFDKDELREVWDYNLKKDNWECEEKGSFVIINRLSRMSQTKGFGNARQVRKSFEQATSNVFSREDFDGTKFICVEDIIGSSPLENEKLQKVLHELDGKIGWKSIKLAVSQMIEIAKKNYYLEIEGKEPISLSMNKLLLGIIFQIDI